MRRTKNREAELALKHKKEEEEQQEASEHWKMVTELLAMLTSRLRNTLTILLAGRSNNDNIDNTLSDFRRDLFQQQKIAEKPDEKFDALLRFLTGGYCCRVSEDDKDL